ncbi:MAG: NAD(P)H-dependent oxidoreductase [Candidatus Thiodiazotropha sp.]
MTRIIGISGSLRKRSFNTALLRAAAELMPPGSELDIRSIEGIPLYNGDDEAAHGPPAAVTVLKDAIAAGDGLLISTPEYNNAMPGVLKNAIDWLSRPPEDIARVFDARPLALMGATPGGFGTVLSQASWLPVFRTLGTRFWSGGRLMVPGASRVFDEAGVLIDAQLRERLARFLDDFVTFVG